MKWPWESKERDEARQLADEASERLQRVCEDDKRVAKATSTSRKFRETNHFSQLVLRAYGGKS